MISSRYNVPLILTDQMVRDAVAKGSENTNTGVYSKELPSGAIGGGCGPSGNIQAAIVPSGSTVADSLTGTMPAVSDADIDFRSLLDDLNTFDAASVAAACMPVNASQVRCKRLGTNVPPILVSANTAVVSRDFQQGARTAQFYADVSHHMASAAPVPREFFAVQIDPLGTEWAVTVWSTSNEFLSYGVGLVMSRTVLNTSDIQVTISNDPATPFSNGALPLPPLGWRRRRPVIRGANDTLYITSSDTTFAALLPWMWRADSAMDTALAEVGRGQLVTAADRVGGKPYAYMASGSSACPAGVDVYAHSIRVKATAPLTIVRALPLAPNNRALPRALATLLGG